MQTSFNDSLKSVKNLLDLDGGPKHPHPHNFLVLFLTHPRNFIKIRR